MRAREAARRPMLNTALSPLAMSMKARPEVIASIDARKEAITCGSRVTGLVGRRPTRAREGASAGRVARTEASPPRDAASWGPTAAAPWSSAMRARSMKARVSSWRRSGVGGLRLTPKETFMARAVSHRLEGAVRRGWQLHLDRVAGPHRPAGQHDRHDAGLAHEPAARVALEGGLHQAGGGPVELGAPIAEAGAPDHA